MPRILHPQWRDYNEPTKYPFGDRATLVNDDGVFLPETVFLDASLYPVGGDAGLYLASVVVSNDTVTLVLGDATSNDRCDGSFDLFDPPSAVRLTDAWGRTAGVLVSEPSRLAVFQTWTVGTYLFRQPQTEFAATCHVPTPEVGVRGIVLEDGSLFTGGVWLVGEGGVVLSVHEATASRECALGGAETVQVIRVDVVGDPLFRRELCGEVFEAPVFLRTITVKTADQEVVCGPDIHGDFKISTGSLAAADTLLRIRTTPNGLLVEAAGRPLGS